MHKPKKSLGQNFLTHTQYAKKMAKALEITGNETIIEIGPGQGIVTKEILKYMDEGVVHAVELDSDLIENLQNMFEKDVTENKLKIVNKNILEFLPDFSSQENTKIIGSLPYYITSPILHNIVYMKEQPKITVILIQREVAEKLAQTAPKNNYLSVFIQTFFELEYIETVPKEYFYPQPKVNGAIVKLLRKEKSNIKQNNIRRYEGFLHRGFSNPRKMLNKVFTKNELEKINVGASLRPQNLTIEEWVNAFKLLN